MSRGSATPRIINAQAPSSGSTFPMCPSAQPGGGLLPRSLPQPRQQAKRFLLAQLFHPLRIFIFFVCIFGTGRFCVEISMLWAITSTLQSSTHNRPAMLSVAWVLCTLVWTASALNITKPRADDTIDISSPYNVTWTWTDQEA